MVGFIFPKSGHLSQLRSPFFTVNQELSSSWALEDAFSFLIPVEHCFLTSVVLLEKRNIGNKQNKKTSACSKQCF